MRSGVGGAAYWERNGVALKAWPAQACEQCGAIGAPQRRIGKRYAEVCIYSTGGKCERVYPDSPTRRAM